MTLPLTPTPEFATKITSASVAHNSKTIKYSPLNYIILLSPLG